MKKSTKTAAVPMIVPSAPPAAPLPVSNVHVFSQDVMQAAVTVRVSDIKSQLNDVAKRVNAALTKDQELRTELQKRLAKDMAARTSEIDVSKEREIIGAIARLGYSLPDQESSVAAAFVAVDEKLRTASFEVRLTLAVSRSGVRDLSIGTREVKLPLTEEANQILDELAHVGSLIAKREEVLAQTVKDLGSLKDFEQRLRAEAARMSLSQTPEGSKLLDRLNELNHGDISGMVAKAGLLA